MRDFDFEFITRNDSWGVESDNLQIVGYVVKRDKSKLNFQIPIKKLKLLYDIAKKPDGKWGFESFDVSIQEWSLNLGEMYEYGKAMPVDDKGFVITEIKKRINIVKQFYESNA